MTARPCGWNPVQATTDCDWDRNCPVHGKDRTFDATVASEGALPMPASPAPLSAERLADYAAMNLDELMSEESAAMVGRMRDRLVDEVNRLRGELERPPDAIEYGIRIPGQIVPLDRTQDTAMWPDRVLMQRNVRHGAWTETGR